MTDSFEREFWRGCSVEKKVLCICVFRSSLSSGLVSEALRWECVCFENILAKGNRLVKSQDSSKVQKENKIDKYIGKGRHGINSHNHASKLEIKPRCFQHQHCRQSHHSQHHQHSHPYSHRFHPSHRSLSPPQKSSTPSPL